MPRIAGSWKLLRARSSMENCEASGAKQTLLQLKTKQYRAVPWDMSKMMEIDPHSSTCKQLLFKSRHLDTSSICDSHYINVIIHRGKRYPTFRERHTTHGASHVTRHTSHTAHFALHTVHVARHTPQANVIRQTSHVTRHTSLVTRHTSHLHTTTIHTNNIHNIA
jgi:hypothetical protein